MKLALKEERYDELVVEAIKQDQNGADVLDVNVGLPSINEAKVMKKMIPMLQEVVTLPLHQTINNNIFFSNSIFTCFKNNLFSNF